MNNKTIGVIVAVVVVVAAGALAFSQNKSSTGGYEAMPDVPGQATSTPATGGEPTPTASGYTMAQVATHGSASSCWSVINGNVYNLTTWIGQHPGGQQAILSICGKDGSAAFNGQHGGAKLQADILVTFKIGSLVK